MERERTACSSASGSPRSPARSSVVGVLRSWENREEVWTLDAQRNHTLAGNGRAATQIAALTNKSLEMDERAGEFSQSKRSDDIGLCQLIHGLCQGDVCSQVNDDVHLVRQTGLILMRYPKARQREIAIDCNDLVHRLHRLSAWRKILGPCSFEAILRILTTDDSVDSSDLGRPQKLFDDSESEASTAIRVPYYNTSAATNMRSEQSWPYVAPVIRTVFPAKKSATFDMVLREFCKCSRVRWGDNDNRLPTFPRFCPALLSLLKHYCCAVCAHHQAAPLKPYY